MNPPSLKKHILFSAQLLVSTINYAVGLQQLLGQPTVRRWILHEQLETRLQWIGRFDTFIQAKRL
jgi:hypothetical protein